MMDAALLSDLTLTLTAMRGGREMVDGGVVPVFFLREVRCEVRMPDGKRGDRGGAERGESRIRVLKFEEVWRC